MSVQPFAGVALELPGNWQGIDPSTAKQLVNALAARTGNAPEMKTDTTWQFIPPGEVTDVFVTINVRPVLLTPHELWAGTQRDIDRFAKELVDAGTRMLTAKEYQVEPEMKVQRVMVGRRTAISCAIQLRDPKGGKVSMELLAIPLESATVMATFASTEAAGDAWAPIIEHARQSLRISDTIAVSAP